MAKYAYFIGVSEYNDKGINPLKCAERDAIRLGGIFEHRLGFETRYLKGQSREDIEDSLASLGKRLHPGDTFVFYFAGHGKESEQQKNLYFLLPRVKLSAFETSPPDGGGLLNLAKLIRDTEQPGWAGVQRVFIFDACRSELNITRSGDKPCFKGEAILREQGFHSSATVDSPLVVLNACSEGQSAIELIDENEDEGSGAFTAALIAEIESFEQAGQPLRIDDSTAGRIGQHMQHAIVARGIADHEQQPIVTAMRGTLPVTLHEPQPTTTPPPLPPGDCLDERLWQFALAEAEAETDPAKKIAILRSHIDDERIETCCHTTEALHRITELKQTVDADEVGGAPDIDPALFVSDEIEELDQELEFASKHSLTNETLMAFSRAKQIAFENLSITCRTVIESCFPRAISSSELVVKDLKSERVWWFWLSFVISFFVLALAFDRAHQAYLSNAMTLIGALSFVVFFCFFPLIAYIFLNFHRCTRVLDWWGDLLITSRIKKYSVRTERIELLNTKTLFTNMLSGIGPIRVCFKPEIIFTNKNFSVFEKSAWIRRKQVSCFDWSEVREVLVSNGDLKISMNSGDTVLFFGIYSVNRDALKLLSLFDLYISAFSASVGLEFNGVLQKLKLAAEKLPYERRSSVMKLVCANELYSARIKIIPLSWVSSKLFWLVNSNEWLLLVVLFSSPLGCDGWDSWGGYLSILVEKLGPLLFCFVLLWFVFWVVGFVASFFLADEVILMAPGAVFFERKDKLVLCPDSKETISGIELNGCKYKIDEKDNIVFRALESVWGHFLFEKNNMFSD